MAPSLVWVARSLGGLGGGVKALAEEVTHRRILGERHSDMNAPSPCPLSFRGEGIDPLSLSEGEGRGEGN
jgi:hypothetical protein